MAEAVRVLQAEEIERLYYISDAHANGAAVRPGSQDATTPEELLKFLKKTGSYITYLDSEDSHLKVEILCLFTTEKRAHKTFMLPLVRPNGDYIEHDRFIRGDRQFSPHLSMRVRLPLLLIDVIDFSSLPIAEQLRTIFDLRSQLMRAHEQYQSRVRDFDGSPIIKYHSVGDGFYVVFGQALHSTPAVKYGFALLQELRKFNVGVGLYNKLYFRMVCHYGESYILDGPAVGGGMSVEPLFIGDIFNDCKRILEACPRDEANHFYISESAHDSYVGDRAQAFSEMKIAIDKKGKKHHYYHALTRDSQAR